MPRNSPMSPPQLGRMAAYRSSKSCNESLTRYLTCSASSSFAMAAATVCVPRTKWIVYVPYRSSSSVPVFDARVCCTNSCTATSMPLSTSRPMSVRRELESAMTDPRMPRIFWRKLSRIFSSCPSIPSSENVESSAFRRESLRCIGLTSRPVQPGHLGLLDGTRLRTAADPEQRHSGRSHDDEQFVGAVRHGPQPHDEHRGCRRGGEGHADRRQDDGNGEGDEPDRERAEEPLDSLFHDEHPGPPDIPVHAGEGDERQSEETAEGHEEGDEAQREDGVCHARIAALILAGFLPADKHIVLNVPVWDCPRFDAPRPPGPDGFGGLGGRDFGSSGLPSSALASFVGARRPGRLRHAGPRGYGEGVPGGPEGPTEVRPSPPQPPPGVRTTRSSRSSALSADSSLSGMLSCFRLPTIPPFLCDPNGYL